MEKKPYFDSKLREYRNCGSGDNWVVAMYGTLDGGGYDTNGVREVNVGVANWFIQKGQKGLNYLFGTLKNGDAEQKSSAAALLGEIGLETGGHYISKILREIFASEDDQQVRKRILDAQRISSGHGLLVI